MLSARFATREVAIQRNMSMSMVDILLRALQKQKWDIPIDSKILLGTQCLNHFINRLDEMYIHFGLEECLQGVLENRVESARDIIDLQLHVDGLSPFKDSGFTVRSRSSAFLMGLLGDNLKPIDGHKLIGHTITELKFLLRNGIRLRAIGRTLQVILHSLLADAAPRDFPKFVKQHTRYFSFGVCTKNNVNLNP